MRRCALWVDLQTHRSGGEGRPISRSSATHAGRGIDAQNAWIGLWTHRLVKKWAGAPCVKGSRRQPARAAHRRVLAARPFWRFVTWGAVCGRGAWLVQCGRGSAGVMLACRTKSCAPLLYRPLTGWHLLLCSVPLEWPFCPATKSSDS